MSKGIQDPAKRVIFLLYKKINRHLSDFRVGGKGKEYAAQDLANLQILRRLKKKGLVGMTEYPSSMGSIYYLTDEGKKIAKPIVDEVDEYKSWSTSKMIITFSFKHYAL